MRDGDAVVEIGHPFGTPNLSVTKGIVSSVRPAAKDLNPGIGFIQFDAPTNPGNSGGPVFNDAGRVIALANAIYSTVGNPFSGPTPQSSGVAFGISSNFVVKAARDIIAYGTVEQGQPRFQVADALPKGRSEFDGMPRETVGAVIKSVDPSAAAALAGVKAGDVIVKAGDVPINSADDFARFAYLTSPGRNYKLMVMRGAARETFDLVMGGDALPPHPVPPSARVFPVATPDAPRS